MTRPGNVWPIRWGQMRVTPEATMAAHIALLSDPMRSICVSIKTDQDRCFSRLLIIGDAMPPSTTDAEPPEVKLNLRRTETGQVFASWEGMHSEWMVLGHDV